MPPTTTEERRVPLWSEVISDPRWGPQSKEDKLKTLDKWTTAKLGSIDLDTVEPDKLLRFQALNNAQRARIEHDMPDGAEADARALRDGMNGLIRAAQGRVQAAKDLHPVLDTDSDELQWDTHKNEVDGSLLVNPALAVGGWQRYKDAVMASDASTEDKVKALGDYTIYHTELLTDTADYSTSKRPEVSLPDYRDGTDPGAFQPVRTGRWAPDSIDTDPIEMGSTRMFLTDRDFKEFKETGVWPAMSSPEATKGLVEDFAARYMKRNGQEGMAAAIVEGNDPELVSSIADFIKDSWAELPQSWGADFSKEHNVVRKLSDGQLVYNPQFLITAEDEEIEGKLKELKIPQRERKLALDRAADAREGWAEEVIHGMLAVRGADARANVNAVANKLADVKDPSSYLFYTWYQNHADEFDGNDWEMLKAYEKFTQERPGMEGVKFGLKELAVRTPIFAGAALGRDKSRGRSDALSGLGNFVAKAGEAGAQAVPETAEGLYAAGVNVATGDDELLEAQREREQARASIDNYDGDFSSRWGRMIGREVAMMMVPGAGRVAASPLKYGWKKASERSIALSNTQARNVYSRMFQRGEMQTEGKIRKAMGDNFARHLYGGMQASRSSEAVYRDAYLAYRDDMIADGMDAQQAAEHARARAWFPAVGAGLITSLVMKAVPGGTERLFESGTRAITFNQAKKVLGEEGLSAAIGSAGWRKAATQALTPFLKEAGKEGIEEALDEMGQGFLTAATYNPDMSLSDILGQSLEAGIAGMILGGVGGFNRLETRESDVEAFRTSVKDMIQATADSATLAPESAAVVREAAEEAPPSDGDAIPGVPGTPQVEGEATGEQPSAEEVVRQEGELGTTIIREALSIVNDQRLDDTEREAQLNRLAGAARADGDAAAFEFLMNEVTNARARAEGGEAGTESTGVDQAPTAASVNTARTDFEARVNRYQGTSEDSLLGENSTGALVGSSRGEVHSSIDNAFEPTGDTQMPRMLKTAIDAALGVRVLLAETYGSRAVETSDKASTFNSDDRAIHRGNQQIDKFFGDLNALTSELAELNVRNDLTPEQVEQERALLLKRVAQLTETFYSKAANLLKDNEKKDAPGFAGMKKRDRMEQLIRAGENNELIAALASVLQRAPYQGEQRLRMPRFALGDLDKVSDDPNGRFLHNVIKENNGEVSVQEGEQGSSTENPQPTTTTDDTTAATAQAEEAAGQPQAPQEGTEAREDGAVVEEGQAVETGSGTTPTGELTQGVADPLTDPTELEEPTTPTVADAAQDAAVIAEDAGPEFRDLDELVEILVAERTNPESIDYGRPVTLLELRGYAEDYGLGINRPKNDPFRARADYIFTETNERIDAVWPQRGMGDPSISKHRVHGYGVARSVKRGPLTFFNDPSVMAGTLDTAARNGQNELTFTGDEAVWIANENVNPGIIVEVSGESVEVVGAVTHVTLAAYKDKVGTKWAGPSQNGRVVASAKQGETLSDLHNDMKDEQASARNRANAQNPRLHTEARMRAMSKLPNPELSVEELEWLGVPEGTWQTGPASAGGFLNIAALVGADTEHLGNMAAADAASSTSLSAAAASNAILKNRLIAELNRIRGVDEGPVGEVTLEEAQALQAHFELRYNNQAQNAVFTRALATTRGENTSAVDLITDSSVMGMDSATGFQTVARRIMGSIRDEETKKQQGVVSLDESRGDGEVTLYDQIGSDEQEFTGDQEFTYFDENPENPYADPYYDPTTENAKDDYNAIDNYSRMAEAVGVPVPEGESLAEHIRLAAYELVEAGEISDATPPEVIEEKVAARIEKNIEIAQRGQGNISAAQREEIQRQLDELGLEDGNPNSIVTALERIASGTHFTPHYRMVARVLLNNEALLNGLGLRIADIDFAGSYGRGVVTIGSKVTNPRGVGDVLVHELIHSVLDRITTSTDNEVHVAFNQLIDQLTKLGRRSLLAMEANSEAAATYINELARRNAQAMSINRVRGHLEKSSHTIAAGYDPEMSDVQARALFAQVRAAEMQADAVTEGMKDVRYALGIKDPETGIVANNQRAEFITHMMTDANFQHFMSRLDVNGELVSGSALSIWARNAGRAILGKPKIGSAFAQAMEATLTLAGNEEYANPTALKESSRVLESWSRASAPTPGTAPLTGGVTSNSNSTPQTNANAPRNSRPANLAPRPYSPHSLPEGAGTRHTGSDGKAEKGIADVLRNIQSAVAKTRGIVRPATEAERNRLNVGIRELEDQRVRAYAEEHGVLFDYADLGSRWEQGGEKKIERGEHKVVLDPASNKVIKWTHAGRPVVKEARAEAPKTGLLYDYLLRVEAHRALLPSDAPTIIGFMDDPDDYFGFSIVTEQPLVVFSKDEEGNPVDGSLLDTEEVKDFLAERGYEYIPDGLFNYYNADLDLLMEDMHDENIVRDANGMIRSYDMIIRPRLAEEKTYLVSNSRPSGEENPLAARINSLLPTEFGHVDWSSVSSVRDYVSSKLMEVEIRDEQRAKPVEQRLVEEAMKAGVLPWDADDFSQDTLINQVYWGLQAQVSPPDPVVVNVIEDGEVQKTSSNLVGEATIRQLLEMGNAEAINPLLSSMVEELRRRAEDPVGRAIEDLHTELVNAAVAEDTSVIPRAQEKLAEMFPLEADPDLSNFSRPSQVANLPLSDAVFTLTAGIMPLNLRSATREMMTNGGEELLLANGGSVRQLMTNTLTQHSTANYQLGIANGERDQIVDRINLLNGTYGEQVARLLAELENAIDQHPESKADFSEWDVSTRYGGLEPMLWKLAVGRGQDREAVDDAVFALEVGDPHPLLDAYRDELLRYGEQDTVAGAAARLKAQSIPTSSPLMDPDGPRIGVDPSQYADDTDNYSRAKIQRARLEPGEQLANWITMADNGGWIQDGKVWEAMTEPDVVLGAAEADYEAILKEGPMLTDASRYVNGILDDPDNVGNAQIEEVRHQYGGDKQKIERAFVEKMREVHGDALEDLSQYLDMSYVDPSFKSVVYRALTRYGRKPTTIGAPPAPMGTALAELYTLWQEGRLHSLKQISKTYTRLAEEHAARQMKLDGEVVDGLEGGEWMILPETDEDASDKNEVFAKWRSLSHPNWCTSCGQEKTYALQGPMYVYRKGGESVLAIRIQGEEVAEIQSQANDGSIPPEFAPDVRDFIQNSGVEMSSYAKESLNQSLAKAEFNAEVDALRVGEWTTVFTLAFTKYESAPLHDGTTAIRFKSLGPDEEGQVAESSYNRMKAIADLNPSYFMGELYLSNGEWLGGGGGRVAEPALEFEFPSLKKVVDGNIYITANQAGHEGGPKIANPFPALESLQGKINLAAKSTDAVTPDERFPKQALEIAFPKLKSVGALHVTEDVFVHLPALERADDLVLPWGGSVAGSNITGVDAPELEVAGLLREEFVSSGTNSWQVFDDTPTAVPGRTKHNFPKLRKVEGSLELTNPSTVEALPALEEIGGRFFLDTSESVEWEESKRVMLSGGEAINVLEVTLPSLKVPLRKTVQARAPYSDRFVFANSTPPRMVVRGDAESYPLGVAQNGDVKLEGGVLSVREALRAKGVDLHLALSRPNNPTPIKSFLQGIITENTDPSLEGHLTKEAQKKRTRKGLGVKTNAVARLFSREGKFGGTAQLEQDRQGKLRRLTEDAAFHDERIRRLMKRHEGRFSTDDVNLMLGTVNDEDIVENAFPGQLDQIRDNKKTLLKSLRGTRTARYNAIRPLKQTDYAQWAAKASVIKEDWKRHKDAVDTVYLTDLATLYQRSAAQFEQKQRAAEQRLNASAPDLSDALRELRLSVDKLQAELFNSDLLDDPKHDALKIKVRSSLGIYLTRSYQMSDRPGYREWLKSIDDPDAVRRVTNAKAHLRDVLIKRKTKKLMAKADKANITVSESAAKAVATNQLTDREVTEALDEFLTSVENEERRGYSGLVNMGMLKPRKLHDKPMRELIGQYDDNVYNATHTMIALGTTLTNRQYLDDLATTLEEMSGTEGDGKPVLFTTSQKVADRHGLVPFVNEDMKRRVGREAYGPLADAYGPEDIVEALNEHGPRDLNGFHSSAMWLAAQTMGNMTTRRLRTHIRNFLGNPMFLVNQGLFASAGTRAIRGDGMTAFLDAASTDGSLTPEFRELLAEYDEFGVRGTELHTNQIQELSKVASESGLLSTSFGTPKPWVRGAVKGVSYADKKAQDLYQAGDDHWKFIAYESMLEKYAKAFGVVDKGRYLKPKELRDAIEQGMTPEKAARILEVFPPVTPEANRLRADLGDVAAATYTLKKVSANNVRTTMPIYNNTWELIRFMKRNGINAFAAPFISFQAEIARIAVATPMLAYKELKSGHPELKRIGTQRLLGWGFTNTVASGLAASGLALVYKLGATMLAAAGEWGDEEDDEAQEDLVLEEWKRDNGLKEALRRFISPFYRDKTFTLLSNNGGGDMVWGDISYMMPFSEVTDPLRMLGEGLATGDPQQALTASQRAVMDFISPYFQEQMWVGAIAAAAEHSTSSIQSEVDPNPLGTTLKNMGKEFMPILLPGTVADVASIFQAYDKPFQNGKRVSPETEILSNVLGSRLNTLDLHYQYERNLTKWDLALSDTQQEFNRLYKSRSTLTASDVEDTYRRVNETRARVIREIRLDLDAARSLVQDDTEVLVRFKNSRLSGQVKRDVLLGQVTRWVPTRETIEVGRQRSAEVGGDERESAFQQFAPQVPSVVPLEVPALAPE